MLARVGDREHDATRVSILAVPWLALTKPPDAPVGDHADSESEERFMDVVASLPVDAQAAETVQPGDGVAQAGAVRLSPLGDRGPDPALPQERRYLSWSWS